MLAPMDIESMDDSDLMVRYRDGDMEAFDILYRRHRGPLYRYCLRQSGDREQAADLFQEIWRRLVVHSRRYRPSARFSTYLYRIAHSCAVDRYRRSARQPVDLAVADGELADRQPAPARLRPEEAAERRRLTERLQAALAQLPYEQREAFVLREEAGLSLEEIAAATGVVPETAKSRLRYAVRKLRDALRRELEELRGTET